MSKRTININLYDSDSIKKAVEQIQNYSFELNNKCAVFVRRLAEVGIPVIDQKISSAIGDSSKNHNTYIKINSFGPYSQAILIVEGKDLLFIEFGAGVYYNGNSGGSPHPLGKELGYTIGSYGKGQGKNDFWFYYADSGEAVMSHGTKATMPVYNAALEIRNKIHRIAREVFGG